MTPIASMSLPRVLIFVTTAMLAAIFCSQAPSIFYFAPLIASAAVLANAPEHVTRVSLTMIFSYLIAIVAGTILSAYLPPSMSVIVLSSTLFYVVALRFFPPHPPALALLAVLVLQKSTWIASMMVLVVVIAMGLLAIGGQKMAAALDDRYRRFRHDDARVPR